MCVFTKKTTQERNGDSVTVAAILAMIYISEYYYWLSLDGRHFDSNSTSLFRKDFVNSSNVLMKKPVPFP